VRSGTSAALNYGEALGTITKSDFTHKLSIVLKELRESLANLKIIESNDLCTNQALLMLVIDECDQLTRLFSKSLQTLRMKNN
jgi:four helix bundle protein